MSPTIAMPQLGLTMTEGTVSSWQKQPGESVRKDEIVLVVSTDKVDMDVEAPEDGTLERIIVESGQTVPVGTPLAYIRGAAEEPVDVIAGLEEDSPGDAVPPADGAVSSQAHTAPDDANGLRGQPVSPFDRQISAGRMMATPRAKRLASELNVDLALVKGSGPRSRICAEDVAQQARAAQPEAPAVAASATLPPPTSAGKGRTPAAASPPRTTKPSETAADPDARRRQLIAERMVESISTIPAFSVSAEVNAENLVSLYASLKDALQREAKVKLTYTDLLLKVLAIASARTPDVNTFWEGGTLRRDPEPGLSFAVATDRGAVAPTLKAVLHKPLDELAHERVQLTERARQGRLLFDDLGEAPGTLSNLGMYRVDQFQGIISPGQTYILAVGSLRKRAWVDSSGNLVAKPTLLFNLSVDHRVADGAIAATLLERIAELIESPYQLLWNGQRAH